MAGKTVAEKMFMKPGHRVWTVNAPQQYARLVGGLPRGATLAASPGGADVIHLFVRNRAELRRHLPTVARAMTPATLVWISYPKGTSKVPTDVNRDSAWKIARQAGLEGVAMVSVDEVWPAMRFKKAGR